LFGNRRLIAGSGLFAKVVFAACVLLCVVGNALAAPNINLSSSFSPADASRTYMDIGGTWDGSAEVSNGDGFTLSVANIGADPAFDIGDILVTVPAGFVLATSTVIVTDVGASCPNMNANASQPGAGNPITVNISLNNSTVINPGCTYHYAFLLTTNTAASAGTQSLGYTVTYNTINNDNGSAATANATQNIDVNAGAISLTKTTAESNPLNNTLVDFNVEIQNTGLGGLFDVNLSDLLGTGLTDLDINPPALPAGTVISASEYRFNYIAAGEIVNVNIQATTDFPLSSNICPTLSNTASVIDRTLIAVPDSTVSIPFNLGALSVTHVTTSRCVLCDTGTVTLRLTNTSGVDVNNLVITEDLLASELLIVNDTSFFGGSAIPNPVPVGTQYTWTLDPTTTVSANSSIDLVFNVVYDAAFGIDENLARNNTTISATVVYALSCGIPQPQISSGNFLLVLDQPLPQVSKLVRNVDANQTVYAPTTFGHRDDDVIWQVSIQNTGATNLQDVILNDSVTGNFVIDFICPDVAAADLAAAGTPPASCFATGGVTTINNFEMADPFGAPGSDAVLVGGTETIYYVGKVTTACGVETNNNDIEWGCNINPPPGGLNSLAIFAGGTLGNANASLSTEDSGAIGGSSVTHTVRGVDGGDEIGSRGIVTITVLNDTGGTIRNVVIDDVLPASYVVDNTFTPTFDFAPAYGVYGGQSDQMAHNIDPLPANLLNNTAPRFTLSSDDTGDNPVVDVNLFRAGDLFTITFQIVLIDPVRFDLVADLDLAEEVELGRTDPDSTFTINNNLTISYDDTCTFTPNQTHNENPAFPVDVEDIDVAISDALFILTNDPGTPLNLHVDVSNNGGHVADNFTVYVTLGEAMTLQSMPANCIATSNPPPHPTWNDPASIPGPLSDPPVSPAAVFTCTPGSIAPGNTVRITFPVEKTNAPLIDDLTFRVDVIGEIVLSDNTTRLTLPAPATVPHTTPALQLANNYSLDAVRSRVLGFNLVKSAWYCAEDGLAQPAIPANILSPAASPPNTPPLTGNLNSQIGEDCNYRIESGGWFGFVTPGFTLIEVRDVTVTDDLPDGQGFIVFDPNAFNFTSTTGILPTGADGGAGSTPLDKTDISWNFNAASGIGVADEFFRVDFKTRLLNENVDLDYALSLAGTNLHGNISTNIARTSFTAVFQSDPIGGVSQPEIEINVSDVVNSPAAGYIVPPGYPAEAVRRVDLTEVEPNLIVTKQVCNETLNVVGPACGAFADVINNGDTDDSYIYRITLRNETSVPVRSPAYNVIATDTLDSSGLMLVVDFATDELDNDGDGFIDALDLNGEGSIAGNTVGVPAVITIDESHSLPLLQIDSGDSVTFLYRVDPHITIAPFQLLTNSVSMSYDSLDGAFGNQNVPRLDNSATAPDDVGRARIYTSITQTADVRMIQLQVNPKTVLALSNTPFVLGADPHDVTIGEEIRYELFARLPVANLRNLTVRDELPFGLRCVEGQTVDLDASPYAAAGFNPGGTFPATCGTAANGRDFVQWNFTNQAVTNGIPGQLVDFKINFIARVENSAITTEDTVLTNGGIPIDNAETCTSAGGGVGICYRDDLGNDNALDFGAVSVTVREPVIVLTKSFAPVTNSDAADELLVTVTATNTGEVAAYNLQILDDLLTADMTYLDNSMLGANAPNDDGVVADSKSPVFSWDRATNPDYEILPAAVKTFSFRVRVDTTAQPLQMLDNTLQAKWDSLPGQDVALPHAVVASGIGVDGSLLGLRNGAVPNIGAPANAPNDYETTIAAQTTVLPLTMTKTDLDVGAVVPTIGAHRNFEVVIALPEGTTEDLIIEDVLASAGVSYVLRRDGAAFDIAYSFEDIVTINGLVPAEAVFRGATAGSPTLPLDGDAGTIRWDIGQVITAVEDDLTSNLVNPRIIINYFARPNNDLATNDGANLQNSATTTYDNGETAVTETLNATTAVQTVVEPLLLIAKAVTNVTNSGVGPVAGDVLEYQITVSHDAASNATAFDTNIVDTLDDNLLLDASFPPTALLDGVAVGGFVAAPTITAPPASALTWGRGNADNNLDIPDGSTLILTYRTVVQNTIEANVVVSNSVLVDWTSLNDTDPSSAFERTGAGCPTVLVPNDYCSAPAVANITADDSNSIIKSIIFDTYDEAPLSTALDSIVRVGDVATYQLDINIQQGITVNVNILDTVPVGMELVDISSINGVAAVGGFYVSPVTGSGSNFSYAPIPITSVPAANDRLTLNWNLGTITNDFAGDAATDTLVIIYRARVFENDAATIAHNPSTTLTNTADFTYIDGNGNGNSSPSDPRLNSTANLTVLQPLMDALTKTDRSGRVSGNPINPATDIMNFRLHSCNTTGQARAYGLLLTDNLPTQLNETTIAGPNNGALAPDVFINGVLATAVTDYVYTPPAVRGGDMVFRFNTPIDPGVCIDIDFDVAFYTDFGFGSFSNDIDINEYYSLPPANAQKYSPLAAAPYIMNNPVTAIPPPAKVKLSADEAAVGDEVVYQITVPSVATGAILYDVTLTDILHASLVYVSAIDTGVSGFTITDTVLPGNTVNLVISQIPAGQQAIIELRARVGNNVAANAGLNFNNSASYTYADSPGGLANNAGSDITVNLLNIVEPVVAVTKAVANITKPGLPPDAGDILRYTIELTAAGGGVAPVDFNSDAFDLSIEDSLSLGLLYNGNETVNGGNTINPPVIVGDGVVTPQTLRWSPANADDIDVSEGTVVTVTYDVLVLDSVLADQNLSNSVDIQWSSRDGPDANERNGSGVPPLNDYFNLVSAVTLQTTPDSNVISKIRLSDTFNPADNIVRIGDIIDYELRINLQEGSQPNFVITDTLPPGLVFEETLSINGISTPFAAVAPFTYSAIAAPLVVGDPATAPTTVSWSVLNLINPGDNLANNDFVIVYRTRVLNLALPQINNTPLANTVNLDYTAATGAAPTKTDNEVLDLQQPNLSITKVQVFTPTSTDSVIDAGEIVRYQISMTNNGSATAYDAQLLDIIPAGLRSPSITMISMALTSAAPLPPIPLPPVYDPVTGMATWNFDSGTADQYNIAAGDTLQLVYDVQANAGLGAGLTLSNRAQIQFYYSFDNNAIPVAGVVTGVREIYAPVDFAEAILTTTPANALLKVNPADLNVSIGETFTYTITVPEIPQATALYDVHILDDLNLSAADLLFVEVTKVSGSQTWTPVNTGTVADNLIVADIVNGIDIPANEQVVIELTVTLRNTDPPNVADLLFTNEATYTFNQINDDNATRSNGLGSITADMTVVEPDLTLEKRGPAGTVNFATPIPYMLVVENIGTGPAFDTTIVDQLPDAPDNPPLTGGTCDVAPINLDLRITTTADETTVLRALVRDTDYTATHTAAPTCELIITTLTDTARIEVGEKLIASYDVSLDPASQSGAALTNIAGVTQWFSLDTAGAGATGEIREYNRTITDGTNTIIDHEAAFTVIVEAPVLDLQKIVENVTTSQIPGSDASPSDVLRYTITVSNAGIIDAAAVTVSDVIPANATYVANSVLLNGFAVADLTPGVSPLIAGIDISSSDLTPPLPAAGSGVISVGETATISFDVLLVPVITSGTVIVNTALVNSPSTGVLSSDDPNINGNDDPLVIGDEDPTETLITSAPAFQIQKTSLDITPDLTVLEAGDSLRYTLLVKNIGQENAVNVQLSDQIPANTTYVANTTTLNGVAVTDPSAGISALAAGLLVNAPENSTAGFLRADTSPTANNVASITFDVVISNSVIDGTVISNQGFVSGDGLGSGVFPQLPSDDPATPLPDDPTLDIVGNVPVVDVLKTVVIQTDLGTLGIVDPGDVLRYTITASNIGTIPASSVVLTDAVPANTTYVANTTRLNGFAVSDSGINGSPLIAGIAISSSDLAPPAGVGSLTALQSAVVTFDVQVNAGTPAGTIISNQSLVSSNEVPAEPSDADGIDANGDQPTIVVVGNVQQLAISKQVLVVGGGVAQAGGQLEYVVRVSNIGSIAASNVFITDNLDIPIAGQMTYVAGSALLNGLPAGVSITGSIITADYATTYGDLAAAGIAELRFRVLLASALNIGETISNTGVVSWNLPAETLDATVDIDIGGTPGSANLNGLVWHDTDFDNVFGAGESLLQDWTVELYRNNNRLANTLSDTNGVFQFSGLPPNLPLGDGYELRYIMPGSVATSATLGTTSSVFTDGAQRITDILAASGSSLQNLNLPRQPNGVVYDSVLRVPVAGVRLTMVNQARSNQLVPASCFTDPNHQNQITLAEGFYKFDLNFSEPTRCAEGDEYEIQVLPPGSDFVGTSSVIIPPVSPVTANAFDVPNCPGTAADQIPATALHCENSSLAVQAAPSVAPRTAGTNYHLKFLFNNVPQTDQIFNNHIAVDPKLDAAVAISKVAGMVNVTRSQLVPYTITINNVLGVPLQDLNVVDHFPAGFKYVAGSSRLDGVEVEPLINNSQNARQLTWTNINLSVAETRVIKLLLVVGSGVGEGEYVNTARLINSLTGEPASGVASATVRVIPDPTFDCTDIIGKVFDDANTNSYQDQGEKGLAGVQVATARGLRVTTDKHGRFHITCAIVPNEVRGSNFIMKVDDRTLPSGYRITTENPRVLRATRGKMLKFNFGASIHRVVRLDLANGVFEKGSNELRPQWRSRIELLIIELQKAPSILRLSYLGENETEKEVENRLDAIDDLISQRWADIDCCYKLTIEKEVFWRKGKPSERKRFK
jgi:uncharacterized repeat protein (TIGR01451 family)/fimbrial isopeptide formation D2 family protein